MKAKDLRVDINNEVLGQMKVLKFQAWESSFQSENMDLRNQELEVLWKYFLANSCSIVLWIAVPLLVALSTFAAYMLSGHTVDVAEALTALALFEILRFPLFMLPQLINNIVEAMISLERVRSF
jgi:ATP-binding cassette subfamily C (CFTR/MRP) protein 1